jgi:hypothetical protein
MSQEQSLSVNNVSRSVDEVVKQFGVWSTLLAVMVVAWQRQRAKSDVYHLSDYMRRDIGLPVNRRRFQEKPLIPPWYPRF